MSALYNLRAFKAAFALAHLLPRPVAQSLASFLSQFIYRKNSLTQSALQSNLHQITGLSGNPLHHLCRANVSLFGQMLADYFLCAGPHAARHCGSLVDSWSGLENLQAAHQSGRGTIIVTGHLGHWELGGIALTQIPLPLTVVTLEEPSTELTRWRQAGRQRLGIKTIVVGPAYPFAFIELIQTLRRNELVAMLVDRPTPDASSPVSFFHRQTPFSSAPALLAKYTGATVLPAFVLRQPNGKYLSLASTPIPIPPTKDPHLRLLEHTQNIASAFQSIIQKYPEQWFQYQPVWPTSTLPSP